MSGDTLTPEDRDAVLEVRSHLEEALTILDQLLAVLPASLTDTGTES